MKVLKPLLNIALIDEPLITAAFSGELRLTHRWESDILKTVKIKRIMQPHLGAEEILMNTSILMWGVIFGSLGFGFFLYGKKQHVIIPIISGIGLMAIPYLISSAFILVATGIVLMALPFIIKR